MPEGPRRTAQGTTIMTEPPRRIRLSRRKGWRLPADAVSVARPGRFGNPFPVDGQRTAGDAVQAFRDWLEAPARPSSPLADRRQRLLAALPALRGRDLACWCALDAPCHADVLLEIANAGGDAGDAGDGDATGPLRGG